MKKASELTVLEVANRMQNCMKNITELIDELNVQSEEKATALAEYDKQMAIKELLLKEDHPVTLVKDLAKGECSNYRYVMEVAVSKYKSTLTKIESYQAILNGWQSVNRYLDVVSKQ